MSRLDDLKKRWVELGMICQERYGEDFVNEVIKIAEEAEKKIARCVTALAAIEQLGGIDERRKYLPGDLAKGALRDIEEAAGEKKRPDERGTADKPDVSPAVLSELEKASLKSACEKATKGERHVEPWDGYELKFQIVGKRERRVTEFGQVEMAELIIARFSKEEDALYFSLLDPETVLVLVNAVEISRKK